MTSSPRRVGRLSVIFTLPAALDSTQREQLERSAKACPVHASLHDDVKVDLEFRYSDNL
jgi:putative redox protein